MYENILDIPPYSLDKHHKTQFLTDILTELTISHYQRCREYRGILDALSFDKNKMETYYDLPFLPVRLFKDLDLVSVPQDNVFKTMTSSGTTGQAVSKIYLDKETASAQQKTLVKIVSSFIGNKRLPMIIIDSSAILKDRAMFSARGAGILGFSIFANDKIYSLDDEMRLNIDAIRSFLDKHAGKPIFLFGFTFIIWKHFYNELLKNELRLDLSNGIIIHGGGWKKLLNESVSAHEFKKRLFDICGVKKIHDYYGMVEQTGTIYMECEEGHLHPSIFSDVIVRRGEDFSVADFGEQGIIQTLSILPKSYPGHSVLTEDEGIILGEDDCKCGRKGKYFKIIGRLKNAEIRGCSDTYESKNNG